MYKKFQINFDLFIIHSSTSQNAGSFFLIVIEYLESTIGWEKNRHEKIQFIFCVFLFSPFSHVSCSIITNSLSTGLPVNEIQPSNEAIKNFHSIFSRTSSVAMMMIVIVTIFFLISKIELSLLMVRMICKSTVCGYR